jgi:hypothetical protein
MPNGPCHYTQKAIWRSNRAPFALNRLVKYSQPTSSFQQSYPTPAPTGKWEINIQGEVFPVSLCTVWMVECHTWHGNKQGREQCHTRNASTAKYMSTTCLFCTNTQINETRYPSPSKQMSLRTTKTIFIGSHQSVHQTLPVISDLHRL